MHRYKGHDQAVAVELRQQVNVKLSAGANPLSMREVLAIGSCRVLRDLLGRLMRFGATRVVLGILALTVGLCVHDWMPLVRVSVPSSLDMWMPPIKQWRARSIAHEKRCLDDVGDEVGVGKTDCLWLSGRARRETIDGIRV